MKKKIVIIGVILMAVALVFLLVNKKIKDDKAGQSMTGGYGSYMQYLNVSIDKVEKEEIIVIANEDTSLPETVKQGDKIRLLLVEPIEGVELEKGQNLKLQYLIINEDTKVPEISMGYPANLYDGGTKIIDN